MKQSKLSLHWCENHEYGLLNHFYYMDEEINHTFGGERKDRLLAASAACIIKKDLEEIGFILLIEEANQRYNIDMGILQQHRGKGYGTQALRLFKAALEHFQLQYQITTHINNIAANQSLQSNDFELEQSDHRYNYYTLNRKKDQR